MIAPRDSGIRRPGPGLRRYLRHFLAFVIIDTAALLSAQDRPPADVQNAPAPAVPATPNAALPGPGAAANANPELNGDFFDAPPAPVPADDVVSRATQWNQSLFDAFQPGGSLGRYTGTNRTAGLLEPLPPANPKPRPGAAFRASGAHPPPRVVLPTLDQLTRQGMNLRFNSSAGTFRLTYREVFGARGNSLGGSMGQGTAAATYTTGNFGKSLVNFSASTFMGGPPTLLMTGGYYNNSLWTAGTQKHPSPTVSLRLTF